MQLTLALPFALGAPLVTNGNTGTALLAMPEAYLPLTLERAENNAAKSAKLSPALNQQRTAAEEALGFPEQRLIERCLSGDRKAHREFYDRYSPKLMAVCMLYSKGRFDAEDLLQEGFIRIFSKLGAYRPIGSFEAWMRRIVVNLAIEHLRKQRRVIYTDEELTMPPDVQGATSTLDAISQKEILEMIAQLPEGYRSIFSLYVFEGMNHREIAEQLGIAEGTSKSQFSRARNYLQRLIANSRAEAKPRPITQTPEITHTTPLTSPANV